ncbi:hypothetical protein LTR85_008963 [Meristemomyces frigidus]|nr:hypothetical protein LTR85_008963 [Meristemomyces frigidus]
MAFDHFSKLPAELRLRIYGLVLDFERLLVRVNSTNVNKPRINISVLAVSKQIHDEAEDVFYELNTFSLAFPEFYYSDNGKVRSNPLTAHPYRSIAIVVDKPMRSCNTRRLVDVLIKASTCAADTKVKSVTVRLEDNYPIFEAFESRPGVEDSLKAAGMIMRFTDIACVAISPYDEVLAASSPRVRIEWPRTIKEWRYLSALPITHTHLGFPPGGPGSFGDKAASSTSTFGEVVDWVKSFYRRQAELTGDQKQQSGQSGNGKLCCEAEHTAEWFEEGTKRALRLLLL